jgi:hypothetical protein
LSGQVVKVNQSLSEKKEGLDLTPYHDHWICVIDAESLEVEIPSLSIGKSAVTLFQEDIGRFAVLAKTSAAGDVSQESLCIGAMERLDDARWYQSAKEFFGR